MKKIKLTQGKVALVDNEDYEFLNQYNWKAKKTRTDIYYADTNIGQENGKQTSLLIHRLILQKELEKNPKLEVDHINHNGLDNQKHNLRLVTRSQNQMNNRHRKNNSSEYRGVSFHKKSNKWQARICLNKTKIHLGLYDNEIDAADAYNKAAIELFKEYGYLNKIERHIGRVKGYVVSEETKKKISATVTGRGKSQETKDRISASLIKYWANKIEKDI